MTTFYHSGDLGDVIAAIPSIQALGGGAVIIGPHDASYPGGMTRQSLKGPRFDGIKRLLEAQPCIERAEWVDKQGETTHDFSRFRHDGRHLENLAQWQARHIGVAISEEPWLTIPSPSLHGRVVIARSQRYHANGFPWPELLKQYRNPIFVGLKSEHYAFQSEFGPVEFQPTIDLLALAQIIAGCSLFIGNQSCPMWIALGIGVPIIQETCPTCPNTIIRRPECRYTLDLAEINALWSELQPKAYA